MKEYFIDERGEQGRKKTAPCGVGGEQLSWA